MSRKRDSQNAWHENNYSPGAVAALTLGLISFIIMVALVLISMTFRDGIGSWGGAVGITAFVIAFTGMWEGLASFHAQSRSYLLSKIGTLLCGFMVAAWFLIFCAGLAQ